LIVGGEVVDTGNDCDGRCGARQARGSVSVWRCRRCTSPPSFAGQVPVIASAACAAAIRTVLRSHLEMPLSCPGDQHAVMRSSRRVACELGSSSSSSKPACQRLDRSSTSVSFIQPSRLPSPDASVQFRQPMTWMCRKIAGRFKTAGCSVELDVGVPAQRH
jgi:hypothetical protein